MSRNIMMAAGLAALAACTQDIVDEDPARARLTKRDRLYDVALMGTNAWIVGFPGIILHSADAGETWEAQQGGGEEALFAVDFVDGATGWIAGRGGLVLHTTDGGRNWKKQVTLTEESLFALDFVDRVNGWAAGNFGVVLHTLDGGLSWTRQTVAPPADAGVEAPAFDRLLNGVSFVDRNTGWIVGESGTILHTTDAGKTWTEQISNEWAPLYSPVFLNPRRGFVAGSEGVILATEDGGETWNRLDTGLTEHLFCLVVSGDMLLAAGRRGTFVTGKPAREGPAFERRPLGVFTWLDAMALGDDGVGLMAGGQGLILRTRDRGDTWAPVALSATALQTR